MNFSCVIIPFSYPKNGRIRQLNNGAAHRGLVEVGRAGADACGQLSDIPRIIFLGGGGQAAGFEQVRLTDQGGTIGDGRNLGRAALLGGLG